jgi:plastocyanin
MRKLSMVLLAIVIVIGTSLSVGAIDTKRRIKILGEEKFVPNKVFASTFRFDPGKVRVKSGASLSWVNRTDAPHTITVVADAPDDFAELFFCREPGGECRAALDAHFATGPPTFVVNVGAAGLDAAGDSLLILEPGGSATAVVSAPAGTTLEYICSIHPWQQGSIAVT